MADEQTDQVVYVKSVISGNNVTYFCLDPIIIILIIIIMIIIIIVTDVFM